MMRSSHEIAGQASKVLEREAWAGPGGYTNGFQPNPNDDLGPNTK